MKFISWNVNGIRACMGKGFMDFFNAIDADIFCLQETKMQEGQLELDLPGYFQYWNYAEKKGYSGTALFTKEEPLSVTYGLGIEEHDKEGRVITAEFADFYFITVYVPNSQDELKRLDYRMKWEDDFLQYVKKLEKKKPVIYCGDLNVAHKEIDLKNPDFLQYVKKLEKKKPVIYCGDLNVAHKEIDLKNPKTNRHNAGFTDEERGKMTAALESGLIDTFRFFYPDMEQIYSWWSYRFRSREKNAGWRIDYFICSESLKERLLDAKIHTEIFGSDHCPIELDLKD